MGVALNAGEHLQDVLKYPGICAHPTAVQEQYARQQKKDL